MKLRFTLHKTDTGSRARRGVVHTRRGDIQTPAFMPVGTFAAVKTLDLSDLHGIGADIILGNTFHLMLRPGTEVFDRLGGIHGFTGWQKPVLTDSGGFQIFCLPQYRKITEEGALFRSYVNGDKILLSPEKSIAVQTSINSDIMMVLDQCIESTSDKKTTETAMHLTHRWALRSLAARKDETQALFAIVQGGIFEDLRRQSAAFLTEHAFDGFAIGGLAVGESKQEREDFTELVAQLLPADKPRYLMGVGTPIDLLEAVYRGVDMFDCVIPTLYAQQGVVFTWEGKKMLTKATFRFSDEKLDAECGCFTCQNHSQGYLHHLAKCKEPTGWRLLSLHNQWFYQKLMQSIRAAIDAGTYPQFYQQWRERWGAQTSTLGAGTLAGRALSDAISTSIS